MRTPWIGSGAGAICLSAALVTPVSAMFDTETVCEGGLVFPNEDGSQEVYELVIILDNHGYALTSTNRDTGETTVDLGDCTDYAGEGCTHIIEVDGVPNGDSYRFRIQNLSDTVYAYQEIWSDGAMARTILTCSNGQE